MPTPHDLEQDEYELQLDHWHVTTEKTKQNHIINLISQLDYFMSNLNLAHFFTDQPIPMFALFSWLDGIGLSVKSVPNSNNTCDSQVVLPNNESKNSRIHVVDFQKH